MKPRLKFFAVLTCLSAAPCGANAQQLQAVAVTAECNVTEPFDDPYQAVTVRAATFAYPEPDDAGSVRFLIATSYSDSSWNSSRFTFDNLPATFWSIAPQRFVAAPHLQNYPANVPANFASKTDDLGKVTGDGQIRAIGVVPIFVRDGKQYCLTKQLKETYMTADKKTKTIVQQLGTIPSSPVFATIEFEFRTDIKPAGK